MRMNPKISVIIASLNEPAQLWSTVCSFKEQIVDLGDSVEIIIGDNSPDKLNPCRDRLTNVSWVPVKAHSTSIVRNTPAATAKGEILCFSDTHVVLANGMLKQAISSFSANPNLGVLHTHTMFWGGGDGFYYYRLNLTESFSGINCNRDANPYNPYLIPASGHGLFFIRRNVFEKIGGYLETQIGWGGEEVFLDLLTWMYGYEVMVDSKCKHWHLPGEFVRPYCRNAVQYMLNHLYAAYVIGGERSLIQCAEFYRLMEFDIIDRAIPEIMKINTDRRNKVVRECSLSLAEVTGMFDDYGMDWREK